MKPEFKVDCNTTIPYANFFLKKNIIRTKGSSRVYMENDFLSYEGLLLWIELITLFMVAKVSSI